MISQPCDGLARRVEQAETAFLQSVHDHESLLSFESSWTSLHADLLQQKDTLDTDTSLVAYTTAFRVATIAKAFSDVYTESSALNLTLNSELGRILDSIYSDTEVKGTRSVRSIGHSMAKEGKGLQPRESVGIDEPACSSLNRDTLKPSARSAHCKWLLEHLHYPFPSAPVKKELAKTLNISIKSLEDWFSNARRKIGWIAFSKRHFQGNRCLTADCTRSVWMGRKRKGDSYSEEVVRELEEVKATAQRLYGPKDGDPSKTSCFAEEIEKLEAEMAAASAPAPAAAAASKSRKRRVSTCSASSEQTVVAPPSSSAPSRSSSSRKRAHSTKDDSDTTCRSESEEISLKPSKRTRSVSSASSRVSQQSSSSTLVSSDTPYTVSEVSTPAMSPTHSHIPLEIVDGWIDGLSAASPFLPHDAADKPTILSHKRPSPDSDSDGDAGAEARTPSSKRARLDNSPLSPAATEERNPPNTNPNPNPERSQSDIDTQTASAEGGAAPPSPTRTPTKALVQTNETTPMAASAPFAQPVEAVAATEGLDVDPESAETILSQLDYSIPTPPTFWWDDEFLGNALEATLASLDSDSFVVGVGDTGLSCSGLPLPDDIDALLAKALVPESEPEVVSVVGAKDDDNGLAGAVARQEFECDDAVIGLGLPEAEPGCADGLEPIPFSLSATDFDFLESLGNTASDPLLGDAELPAPCAGGTSDPLVDVAPVSELPVVDSERAKKLERIEQLLAEAQRLQQEVFG